MNDKMNEKAKRKVVYVADTKLLEECDKSPHYIGRASLVHNLIEAYRLLSHMTIIPSKPASVEEMQSFHSSLYIEYMQKVNDSSDLENHEQEAEEFGFGYDCPLLDGLFDFASTIAGGSISGARALVDGTAKVAINWCGGWHHAQRDEAEGFCYVNDIVLAVHKLREKYQRILYVDLDIHHGNGVENAFAYSPSVMTLSIHKFEPGFYPGSGSINDVGFGKGRYYSVNVPLNDGIRDDIYSYVFDSVSMKVWAAFQPHAVVVQCGADVLNKDPIGSFNLTSVGLAQCVERVLSWEVPTLFLGGGGYNNPNVARCWTYLTSVIIGCDIPSDIPDHEYFEQYSPDFEIAIEPGYRPDCNKKEEIEDLINSIDDKLSNIFI